MSVEMADSHGHSETAPGVPKKASAALLKILGDIVEKKWLHPCTTLSDTLEYFKDKHLDGTEELAEIIATNLGSEGRHLHNIPLPEEETAGLKEQFESMITKDAFEAMMKTIALEAIMKTIASGLLEKTLNLNEIQVKISKELEREATLRGLKEAEFLKIVEAEIDTALVAAEKPQNSIEEIERFRKDKPELFRDLKDNARLKEFVALYMKTLKPIWLKVCGETLAKFLPTDTTVTSEDIKTMFSKL